MEINLNFNIPNIRIDLVVHNEDPEMVAKLNALKDKVVQDTESMQQSVDANKPQT